MDKIYGKKTIQRQLESEILCFLVDALEVQFRESKLNKDIPYMLYSRSTGLSLSLEM